MRKALFNLLIVCLLYLHCLAAENKSEPVIRNCPPLYNPYTVKCDLNYTDEQINLIFEKIKKDNIFGICPVSISTKTMDMLVFLEPDENELIQNLVELRKESGFFFTIETTEGEQEICIGLAGKEGILNNILGAIKAKHTVNRIVEGPGLCIDMKGNDVPFWKVIGQLAQKAHLGLQYEFGRVNLVPDYRKVLAYDSKGPFFIYYSKDISSGKLVLDILYYTHSHEIKSTDSINIKDVVLSYGQKEREISGQKVVFERNIKRDGWVEWISDGQVELKKGLTVKVTIEGLFLAYRYCIDNLHCGSRLKNDKLSINVGKYAASTTAPSTLKPKTEKVAGEWMCVEIQTSNKPSHDGAERQKLEKLSVITVPSIGKRVPDSKIQSDTGRGFNSPGYNLRNGRRIYKMETRNNRTYICFDSIQNGSDIFPMGIELWQYQPALLVSEFEVVLENRGLSPIK